MQRAEPAVVVGEDKGVEGLEMLRKCLRTSWAIIQEVATDSSAGVARLGGPLPDSERSLGGGEQVIQLIKCQAYGICDREFFQRKILCIRETKDVLGISRMSLFSTSVLVCQDGVSTFPCESTAREPSVVSRLDCLARYNLLEHGIALFDHNVLIGRHIGQDLFSP